MEYVHGFVQGVLVAELLTCMIHLILSNKAMKYDLQQLDKYNDNIERDLRFSQHLVNLYNNQEDRIQNLEKQINVGEEEKDDE